MQRTLTSAIVFGLLIFLAGCASTATSESQTKPQSSRQARVYFLRESNFNFAVALNITINGQKVGELASRSYFFFDRDPGEYTLTVDHPLSPGRFSARITLRPGAVYYVEVAPRTEGIVIGLTGGFGGALLEAAVSENSGLFSLVPLEEAAGRAKLAGLKN